MLSNQYTEEITALRQKLKSHEEYKFTLTTPTGVTTPLHRRAHSSQSTQQHDVHSNPIKNDRNIRPRSKSVSHDHNLLSPQSIYTETSVSESGESFVSEYDSDMTVLTENHQVLIV